MHEGVPARGLRRRRRARGVHGQRAVRARGPDRALPQGADRPTAVAHRPWDHLKNANPALQTISTGLSMVAAMGNVDLVHSHTWYANMAETPDITALRH